MRIRPAYQNALGRATFELNATGDGSGVSTLRMQASANTTLELVGDANFYTDSGGTTGESKTTVIGTSLTTIYLKCATTAKLIIPEQRLITGWGNTSTDGWISSTNAATISSAGFPLRNLTNFRIAGNSSFNGALPTGLTYLRLNGNTINWTYSGALPTGLTLLYLNGNNINWTYNGALPTGLTLLYLTGNNINWTYNGVLPTGLTFLLLLGTNINWTYSGALPTGLTYLYLEGNNINWTYLDVSGTGNITTFSLTNFLTTPMTAAQLITLLTSMAGRTGNLPATCTIQDYSNSPTAETIRDANANVNGTDAEKAKYWITQIFANKATTRVALQGTTIDKP